MFQILSIGCQNISFEAWIKTLRFTSKIRSRSEDINKIQTEF